MPPKFCGLSPHWPDVLLQGCEASGSFHPRESLTDQFVELRVDAIEALHFQGHVSVQQFRDARHAPILRPGLPESVCHAVLAYELAQRGLRPVSQQAIPVVYGTIRIDIGFRADLIVEDRVIVEIKSVEALAPVHKRQLPTYLRLADRRLGLLINFNAALIKPPGRQENT